MGIENTLVTYTSLTYDDDILISHSVVGKDNLMTFTFPENPQVRIVSMDV